MTELTLTLIRVAFLAVLWLFVIAAIGVVRTDLSGSSAGAVAGRPAAGTRAAAADPGRTASRRNHAAGSCTRSS